MNGTRFVSDTNVILYVLKGIKKAADQINNKEIYVSIITEIELLSYKNATVAELQKAKDFLSECIIVDLNSNIKDLAIELRRKYGIKTPDAIICATANYFDLPLITSDKKLKNIQEITVLYYEG